MNRLPGWEPGAWGYHGDDGQRFTSSGIGQQYAPTFTAGDIVGCAIDFPRRVAFYTINGELLDAAFKCLTFTEDIYPTVGTKSYGEHVRLNFGKEPFMFDITGYIESISNPL